MQDRRNGDGTEGGASGFKITFGNASNIPAYVRGVLVVSNNYGLFMELYNTTNGSATFTTATATAITNFESGKVA